MNIRRNLILIFTFLCLLWAAYELGRASMEQDMLDKDDIRITSPAPRVNSKYIKPRTRIF